MRRDEGGEGTRRKGASRGDAGAANRLSVDGGGIEGQARAGRRLYRRCIHDRVVFCPCKGSGIRWGWRRGGLIGRWEGVRRAHRTLLTIEELGCLAIIEDGREMEEGGEADGDH